MARAADKCRVIAVNDAVYPCWYADFLHACDNRWWEANNGVPGYRGFKTSLEPTKFEDVMMMVNTGTDGYDPQPGCMRSGSNSAYQAVHFAAQLGAKKIIIHGVDFTDDGARMHWFGLHKEGMDKPADVVEWRVRFHAFTDILAEIGIEVVNVGRQSTLKWLRQSNLATELG